MDRLLYVSSVGLRNVEMAQAARAHNLANVSTPGFRADLARVQSEEVAGDGYRGRVYGVNQESGVNMAQGPLVETQRPLDVAVSGEGLFTVLRPDGTEAHTRSGRFTVDATGRLLSEQGFQVMGRIGPIALPPFESLVFGADGSVTVQPQGQGPENLVQIDQLKLVNPEPNQVRKDSMGMLTSNDGVPFEIDDGVTVTSGFIESSNVNAIEEITEIITLARQFELEVRMMRTAQTNDEAAAQLLRIG